MSDEVKDFTIDELYWAPFVPPLELEQASPEQRDALSITPFHSKVSEFLLVLAHDPETLKGRSPLYNQIMASEGGLSRGDRELGAVAASIASGCVLCASVHGRHFNTHGKRPEVTAEIFAKGLDAELDERDAAIFTFSKRLATCPPTADAEGIARLRSVGLDTGQIADLVHAVALFGWASRVMRSPSLTRRRCRWRRRPASSIRPKPVPTQPRSIRPT